MAAIITTASAATNTRKRVNPPSLRSSSPVAGVAPEMTERGHCTVRRPVTHHSAVTAAGHSRVVSVGDGEFGRGEDRLADVLRERGRGLSEPTVLPLVVPDDPFEP